MTRNKMIVVGAVLGLSGAGLVGYLVGARSGAGVAAEAPTVPTAEVDPDAQRLQREAWQKVAAALASAPASGGSGDDGGVASAEKASEAAPQATAEPKPMTAVEERDKAVAHVKASGPDQKGLLKRAEAVGGAWATLAKKLSTRADIGPWECHAAGCLSTMVHQSETEVEDLTNEISRQDEFRTWEGPKMRSGPIKRPDGATEITWILYSGDEATRTQ